MSSNILLIYHLYILYFFFNDTATTEIYTLSLHDALPIWIHEDTGSLTYPAVTQRDADALAWCLRHGARQDMVAHYLHTPLGEDRKSTRLNSSHSQISYAVFCLKKKKKKKKNYKNNKKNTI